MKTHKKFFIENPHTQGFFGPQLQSIIFREKSFPRFRYIIEKIFNLPNYQLKFLITQDSSSFFPRISKFIPIKLEVFIWKVINGYTNVPCEFGYNNVKSDDVLFTFARLVGFEDSSKKFSLYQSLLCHKIIHLTHFELGTQYIMDNMQKLKPDVLVAEGPVFESQFFKKYFSKLNARECIVPHNLEKRFQSYNDIGARTCIALAVGTFETLKYSERTSPFIDHFKTDTLHFIRRELNDYLTSHKVNFVTNRLSDFYGETKQHKSNMEKFKSLWGGSQKAYFKFNMVAEFNKHRMFVCGEEIVGTPGIGMLEGMACGCIYIGRSDLDYSVFGMIPDVHFLTYDGSVESLFHCIEGHANEIDKLNLIQQNAAKLLVKLLNTGKQFEKALDCLK